MGIDDDHITPWGDPDIRKNYEAALGRFILAFNEVDYRIGNLIREYYESLDQRGLIPSATNTFANRLEAFAKIQDNPKNLTFEEVSCGVVKCLSKHRNALAHGHFDENPFNGTYELFERTMVEKYPIEKIDCLTKMLRKTALQLRRAEQTFGLQDVVLPPAT